MLRGLALAVLLLNLALWLWGRQQLPAPISAAPGPDQGEVLPSLVLLGPVETLPAAPELCLSLGPVTAEEAAELVEDWLPAGVSWRRRDIEGAIWLDLRAAPAFGLPSLELIAEAYGVASTGPCPEPGLQP